MYALITGGTSGIGKDIAINLGKKGYDLILVSRHYGDTDQIKEQVKTNVINLTYDLTSEEECFKLVEESKKYDIEIFINNAGFGDIGYINKTDLRKEINMVKVNDIATLILTKSFLLRFMENNKGKVLIVASAAAFGVAPYMNVYYATKAFAYSLAHGYYRELKDKKSKVSISVLCPGPVKTRFEEVANTKFNIKSLSSQYVGKYTVKKFLKGKFIIVPGLSIKLAHTFSHLVPKRFISKIVRKQASI
ncbi:MAG: SDR family NAD(P)-dependent oxidoreductase [Acholeplasmatales bacterium]|nr:SDR family NAD(P)-dependent oxidoreductase [Acholeplasmatales bacterium]